MEFLSEPLTKYIENHSSKEPTALYELYRETNLKAINPIMLSGHLQGRFLSMLVHLIKPKLILELGTYTGYSAICLAEGLPSDSKIISVDRNEELFYLAKKYFEKSGVSDKIELMVGNAMDIIPKLDLEFDMVFIDADKLNYLNYYHLIIDKVKQNGLILADNILWYGKVVTDDSGADTLALKAFNEFVQNDPRVENVLMPLRDGMMMIRKL